MCARLASVFFPASCHPFPTFHPHPCPTPPTHPVPSKTHAHPFAHAHLLASPQAVAKKAALKHRNQEHRAELERQMASLRTNDTMTETEKALNRAKIEKALSLIAV